MMERNIVFDISYDSVKKLELQGGIENMKMQMEKIIMLLIVLAAILFTGCKVAERGTTKVDENLSQTEQNITLKHGIRHACAATKDGVYRLGYWKGHSVITYIDYTSLKEIILCGRPECSHSDESCSAFIPDNESDTALGLQVVGNKLLRIYVSASQSALPNIWAYDLDGTNPKKLCEFPANWHLDPRIYEDGENLYIIAQIVDENEGGTTQKLIKVGIADGQYDVIQELPEDAAFILQGGFERNLWMMSMNDESMLTELSLINVDTGEIERNITQADTSEIGLVVKEESIYLVSDKKKEINRRNYKTGEETVISFADITKDAGRINEGRTFLGFPFPDIAQIGWYDNEQLVQYLMDLNTNSWKRFTLLNLYNGSPLAIYGETEDDLLVQMDWFEPTEEHPPMARYAMISKEDYRKSEPNYRYIDQLCQK